MTEIVFSNIFLGFRYLLREGAYEDNLKLLEQKPVINLFFYTKVHCVERARKNCTFKCTVIIKEFFDKKFQVSYI